ncbi:MAG TPA: hypothetical protein VLS49_01420 [Usitatibacter sp.]|nr:hypothetical protein [Usitatibacter sp.]
MDASAAVVASPFSEAREPGLLLADPEEPVADPPQAAMASIEALEAWAKGYREGTAFASQRDYAQHYAASRDRDIRFAKKVVEADAIITLYEARSVDKETGKPWNEQGVAVFYFKDGTPYVEEHAALSTHQFDLGVAGQAADVGTTAAGLAHGFSEGNPALSSLGPAGMAGVGALKVWMAHRANGYPIVDCIAWKQTSAAFGWGAAAWNVGVLAAVNPVIGAVAGLATAFYTSDRHDALRACALAKLG